MSTFGPQKLSFLPGALLLKTQKSAPISSNLATLGSFKARIRLTLAVPKRNKQYASSEETQSATLTTQHEVIDENINTANCWK